MSQIDVARPQQLGEVYDAILAPSFPASQLVDRASFLTHSTWGEVLVTTGADGELKAAAVGDYSRETELLLVEYLAVAPGERASGAGGELFTAAGERWNKLVSPGAFLAELSRPGADPDTESHGDPERRLAFFSRLGMKALALPYYQPAVSPDQVPVADLLLGIVVQEPSWVDGEAFLEGSRIEAFLHSRNPDPTPAELPAWERLLEATRGPIRLLDLARHAEVPLSGPIG